MKCVATLLTVLGLSASTAWADYVDPPGWDDNPYFTHQSWDFSSALNPMEPDGQPPVSNPYGTPQATILNPPPGDNYALCWINDIDLNLGGGPEAQGGWRFDGPASGSAPAMRLDIPNLRNDDLKKELWFQGTVWTNNPRAETEIFVEVYDNLGNPFTQTSKTIVSFGAPVNGGSWVHATYTFELSPQPVAEYIVVGSPLQDGESIIVDQIDVDTCCIPEPETIVLLLGVGAVCLVGGLGRRLSRRCRQQ